MVTDGHRSLGATRATQSHVVVALAHEFVVGRDQIPEAIVWMNIFITRLGRESLHNPREKVGRCGKAAQAALTETNAWHC